MGYNTTVIDPVKLTPKDAQSIHDTLLAFLQQVGADYAWTERLAALANLASGRTECVVRGEGSAAEAVDFLEACVYGDKFLTGEARQRAIEAFAVLRAHPAPPDDALGLLREAFNTLEQVFSYAEMTGSLRREVHRTLLRIDAAIAAKGSTNG